MRTYKKGGCDPKYKKGYISYKLIYDIRDYHCGKISGENCIIICEVL